MKLTGGVGRFRERLVAGMTAQGYTEDFAEKMFRQLEGFGAYGFPESHAASFALRKALHEGARRAIDLSTYYLQRDDTGREVAAQLIAAARLPTLPDLPTTAEAGLPQVTTSPVVTRAVSVHVEGGELLGGRRLGRQHGGRCEEQQLEEQGGATDDGADHGGTLPFATGEPARQLIDAVAESNALEEVTGALLDRRIRGRTIREDRDEDVLEDRAVREEMVGLEDEPDPVPAHLGECGFVELRDGDPVEEDRAFVGLVEAADQVEERAFPHVGAADQNDGR